MMLEHLDALGYENQVFVPTYDLNSASFKPNANVCICECFQKWDRLLFDYKQRKIQRSLEVSFKVSNYNLIHAYTLFTDGNCARKLSLKYKIPYVVAVRNTDVNDFFRLMPHLRKRGVQILRDAAAVFFLSEVYRKQVFEKYIPKEYKGEIGEKTYIIPNGIDDFWLKNKPEKSKAIDKNSIKLIYAGRIDKNKNIPTIQKAMAILRKQGYRTTLSVIGNVLNKKEFQLIDKDQFTTYYSAMPKEKLIRRYQNSDIFVMPSFTETFGLVYAEAMSQGLPVIYSKNQGFDQQFDEGYVGYHVIANSPEDVAKGIRGVIENYSNIQKNVVSAARKFSWAKLVQEYDKVYRMAAQRNIQIDSWDD